ncbi:MAG TPA: VOC family protein [Myxococcota bacterium]|nr:VOC family protein [Myxococcota bacterium]
MIRTAGLYHLHLHVADLERSLRFYTEVFGMRELFRDGPQMVFLQTPGSKDLLTLNGDASLARNAGASAGVDHFGFQLAPDANLDEAIAEVEKAGGKLLRRSGPDDGRRYAYVSDPDGYTIEL